jgi:hypothetical protein
VRSLKWVLLVCADDVSMSLRRMQLKTWSYRVLLAPSVDVAQEMLLAYGPGEIDVLMIEAPIEGQDELLRTAKRLDPELRTVIVGDTAYWRETLADVYLPKGLPKAEMELRERLKILASRKRGPKKPAASVPLVDVDVRRRA